MLNRTTLLASLAVAVLGGVLFALHLRHFEAAATGEEFASVVVVTAPLQAGQVVRETHIGLLQVPGHHLEERHVRASDLDRVLGVPTERPVAAGNWLTWNDVGADSLARMHLSESLQEGQRAFSVELKSQVFGRMIAPGDRVDVLLTALRPESDVLLTTVLVQNVLVLSVGRRRAALDGSRDEGSQQIITLSVNLQEAAAIAHAQHFALRLSLVVRNPDDESILSDSVPVVSAVDLVAPEQREVFQFMRPVVAPRIERVD